DPSANPIQSGVVLPSARTVDIAAEVPGVEAESIARTAPTAWAMVDPARARRGEEPSQAHHDTPGSAAGVVRGGLGSRGGGAGHGGERVRRTVILAGLVVLGATLVVLVRAPLRPRGQLAVHGHRVFGVGHHAVRGIDVVLEARRFGARRTAVGWEIDGRRA